MLKAFTPMHDLKIIYNAMVGSIINYSAPLLLNTSKIDNAPLIQMTNSAHKIICGTGSVLHCLGDPINQRNKIA
jgi:hypothetical protein